MTTLLQAVVCLLTVFTASTNADHTCAFGREPSMCYSGCPADCRNINSTVVAGECDTCASGCFCPSGLVQFDSQLCVLSEQCSVYDDGLEIPSEDKCSQYQSCGECISSNPDCQWCPFAPGEESVKGSRCRDRDANPVCPEELNDPVASVEEIANVEFDNDVQIRPQKLKLKLRAGQPEEFTLQFRPSENFPLDVYFLLDVTGSFAVNFRSTVKPLATQLVDALQNISDRYAIGFGGFADKRALPYALPSDDPKTYQARVGLTNEFRCPNTFIELSDCNPTISFRHTTNLTQVDTQQLQDILGDLSIHLNVDSLEGGMDGLVQVLICRQEIGWRDRSLRMLLLMSNAGFHLAGDGKVGGAFRPNPGVCLLEEREEEGRSFYEYNHDAFYDYPSIYQLKQLIRSSQTNIVFAITEGTPAIADYMLLREELDLGPTVQVTSLESDSSNIVSVIQSSYDSITQEIRLSLEENIPELDFSFSPGENCVRSEDGEGCSGVALGTIASLNVAVNMTSCLPGTTVVRLQSAVFGTVELEIEPLCECPCSTITIPQATECGQNGDLQCGKCVCNEGWQGDRCQCLGNVTGDITCGPSEENQCSGRERGVCECGTCHCHIQEELLRTRNISEPYFGEHCQCDHLSSCGGLSEDGELCSGRGKCNCESDICECEAVGEKSGRPFDGDQCQCDPDFCFNEEYPNGTCVYTGSLAGITNDAECGCNVCECGSNAEPAGDGTCRPKPSQCSQEEQCARCLKDLQSSTTDCEELRRTGGCDAMLFTDGTTLMSYTECSFVDDDGCTHTFYIVANSSLLVEDDRECGGGDEGGLNPLAWIIPVAVIGGLLALGVLILLIVLLIIWILDRYEFKKFQSNLEGTDWVPQENPIYVSPQQQYTNIAYKRSQRRQ